MVDTYIKGNINKEIYRPVRLSVPVYIKFNGVAANTRHVLGLSRPGSLFQVEAAYIKSFTTNGASTTTATVQLVGNFQIPGSSASNWLGLSAAVNGTVGTVLPDTAAEVGLTTASEIPLLTSQLAKRGTYTEIGLDIAGGTAAQDTIFEGEVLISGWELVAVDSIEPTKTVEYGRIGLGSGVKVDRADPNGPLVLNGVLATAVANTIFEPPA